jgi:hypothetical protein
MLFEYNNNLKEIFSLDLKMGIYFISKIILEEGI